MRQVSVLVLLATSAVAQSSLPPGWSTTEGGSEIGSFGAYSAARYQVVNDDLRGGNAKMLTSVSLRQDGGTAAATAVARSWSNLRLIVSDADITKIGSTFTTNFVGTPTMQFSGSLSWPDLTSRPTTAPAPWNQGGLRIPFTDRHAYTARNALLFDFEFSGGTLSNNGAWSGTSVPVVLDALRFAASTAGASSQFGLPNTVANRCQFDTGNVQTDPKRMPFSTFFLWADRYTGNPSHDQKHRWRSTVGWGPKNSTVIHGVSVSGTTSRTNPGPIRGLGCQPLFLGLAGLFLLQTYATDALGFAKPTGQRVSYVASAVGAPIWSQAVWTDSSSKAAKMTWGSRCLVPAMPPKEPFHAAFVYRTAPSSPVVGPVVARVPLLRVQ